jgi:hypothetical protein
MVTKMHNTMYAQGDLVAVPLPSGGYGPGLVGRILKAPILFGYFFRPRLANPPSLQNLGQLSRADLVLARMFGHQGLLDGTWLDLGQMPGWDRDLWPLPSFGLRQTVGRDAYFRVECEEKRPLSVRSQVPISKQEFDLLPEFGVSGHVWIQEKLDRLLLPIAGAELSAGRTTVPPNIPLLLDNDDAMDWLGHLLQADEYPGIDDALARVIGPSYVDASIGGVALAAAEIVAAAVGSPAPGLSADLLGWVRDHSQLATTERILRAQAAVARVTAGASELRELWEASPSKTAWEDAVGSLSRRLER